MNYQISNSAITDVEASCIVVTLDQSGKLSSAAEAINNASGGFIKARFDAHDIEGKTAQTLLLPAVAGVKAERVLLVGIGKDELNATSANKVLTAIASATSSFTGTIAVALEDIVTSSLSKEWLAEQLAMAVGHATYRYEHTKSKKDEDIRQPSSYVWIGSINDTKIGGIAATIEPMFGM